MAVGGAGDRAAVTGPTALPSPSARGGKKGKKKEQKENPHRPPPLPPSADHAALALPRAAAPTTWLVVRMDTAAPRWPGHAARGGGRRSGLPALLVPKI